MNRSWRRTALLALGLATGSFGATFTLLVALDVRRALNQWRNQL